MWISCKSNYFLLQWYDFLTKTPMTVDAFLEALKGLTSVPASILEHLEALASYMTDEQRAQAIKDFTKLNKDAEKSLKKVEKFVEKSKKDLSVLQKKEVPKLRAMQEEYEQGMSVGRAEEDLGNMLGTV